MRSGVNCTRPNCSDTLPANAHEQRLRDAGYAFERMALGQQRYEQQVDRLILTDDDAVDLLAQ
jgi:hypothetical protein